MRILDVIRTSEGGRWTIPILTHLQQRGHTVALLVPDTTGRLGREAREAGLPVRASVARMTGVGSLTPLNLLRLRWQIAAFRPDVVVYQLIQTALAVRLASLGEGYSRVHQVPGPLYLESPVIRPVERVLVGLDDHVIVGDPYTRSRYQALGVADARVSAIPFGIDIPRFLEFDADRAALRAQWGIPQEDFVVVMFAYFYPPRRSLTKGIGVKGHEVLCEAWRRFAPRHPDARLLLVGDGWGPDGERHRAQIVAAFRQSAPPGSVMFIDGQSDCRPFYRLADVNVAPSMSESLGAPIEAGAMAVPSIVSDAGGLPQTVGPDSGWLFPKGDAQALARCLEAAHDAWRMGRLHSMGAAAQEHMVDLVDSRVTASHVADIVERIGAGYRGRITGRRRSSPS